MLEHVGWVGVSDHKTAWHSNPNSFKRNLKMFEGDLWELTWHLHGRSSRPGMFCKKSGVLRSFAKFTGKHGSVWEKS